MWVAQITEPLTEGEHNEVCNALMDRFPGYQFSIMMVRSPFVIARPRDETIMFPEDEATENEMLRHIVTMLLKELL